MKIRTGFVSNSSSSSFCIVGVVFNREDFPPEKELMDDVQTALKEYDNYKLWDTDDGLYPVKVRPDWDEGECGKGYIGLPIEKMNDSETLAEFKKRAEEKLKELGWNGNGKVEVITGTYRA